MSKGSWQRPYDPKKFKKNYDKIKWGSEPEKQKKPAKESQK